MASEDALLIDLGRALHQATIPADVVEERLEAVARRLGITGQFFTLQSFFTMEVQNGGPPRVAVRRMSFDTHWNLKRMTALLALADDLAAGRIGVDDGRRKIAEIAAFPPRYSRPVVVAAYGVYGAAVAARVGGGWLEMLVGAVVGVAAGLIHFGTMRNNAIDLQKSFIAALIGSLCAFALTRVLPPFDAPRAVFGGITLLVPAMVVTIGVHELASEALESGTIRMAYGLLRFVMLSAGIAAAVAITHAAAAPDVTATPLPWLPRLAIVGIGGVALIFCLQGGPRDAAAIVIAVLLAYETQELSKWAVGPHGAPAFSAFVLGSAAYLHAHATGRSVPVMVVPGLLQLAPGFLGTQAVLQLIGHGAAAGNSGAGFFEVIEVAVQLATGLLLASLLFGRRRPVTQAESARRPG
ncbi:MAG TPA: threonine/serine exporter family protein [Polyangia bacterium]|nr:threonine/serine exporter family protein [Polyangia bacterium]